MTITTAARHTLRFHSLLWAGAAAMLLIPAAAMMLTPEIDWGLEDFAVFGLMLAVLCLFIEAAWHWLDTPLKRLAAVIFAVLAFLTVWVELAVGIFD